MNGVSIIFVGNELQFIFTCIDKADPSRPFYFSLNIDSNKKYQGKDDSPIHRDFIYWLMIYSL